ncbi:ADP-ribosylation factor-like protein 14 [Nothobranchius furzeri]|uniref:ADP-ribosylation factor-like protein 14 n=1 Tax=Nothobranchius furzeri TaxID=105023 RepID=A0A9D3BVC9_NOTFU|nr:ADP-ribosylation factor-like protein 14 [Nothobranchius furzeri]KAF7222611.1 ADP-ribosylation factor-like protein 14 [Nothobranchius furzeri]
MGHPVSKQPQVQVLLLGLDNAGKSTLLYKMKHKASVTTVPTIGFNVATLEARKNRKNFNVTLWDVGGQRKMREHWPNYYQNTAALVFVLDASDRGRLEEARRELEKAMRSDQLRGCPLILLANKQDASGALTVTELKDKFHMRKMCSGRDWFVQPCSASTGFGVEEAYRRVVQMVRLPSEDVKDNIKETVLYLRSNTRQ